MVNQAVEIRTLKECNAALEDRLRTRAGLPVYQLIDPDEHDQHGANHDEKVWLFLSKQKLTRLKIEYPQNTVYMLKIIVMLLVLLVMALLGYQIGKYMLYHDARFVKLPLEVYNLTISEIKLSKIERESEIMNDGAQNLRSSIFALENKLERENMHIKMIERKIANKKSESDLKYLTLIHVCGVRADPREIPQVRMWLLSESQNQEST